jgi:hypothetical protein
MRKFILIFLVPLLTIFCFHTKQVQAAPPWLHVSALLNYEATKSYSPGFDFNILFQNTWGIRYSFLPAIRLGSLSTVNSLNGTISLINAESDLNTTMIMRTLDYRSFPAGNATPLDFLTAYLAFGYNEIPITIQKTTYSVLNSKLASNRHSKQISSPVYTAAFGLYGGERFVVIDGHLLYVKGLVEDEEYLESSLNFEHWLIIIGIGIGF